MNAREIKHTKDGVIFIDDEYSDEMDTTIVYEATSTDSTIADDADPNKSNQTPIPNVAYTLKGLKLRIIFPVVVVLLSSKI